MAKFKVYKDLAGEYRWRFIASNGRIMATSSEGYINHKDAESSIERFKELAPQAEVIELEEAK